MKKLTFEQLQFIKKEYTFLSNNCSEFFNKKDDKNLHAERIRIGVFINTIEKLFNCDFYKEIKPLI